MRTPVLRSRAGQGMIEYLMIVIVSVIIIAGLAVKLYAPLDKFISALTGSYVACLLETGDLPALGADNTTGECKPPDFKEIAGDGGKSTAGQNSTKKKDNDDADKVKPPPRTNRQQASNDSPGRAQRPLIIGQGPKANADGGGGDGKRTNLGEAATETNGYFGGGGGGSIYRRQTKYIAVSGELAEEVKKRQERENAKTSTAPTEGDGGVSMAKKKISVSPPPPKKPLDDDQGASFDLSQIIKYILIAGIIIVILVLIGGQAMQLSKSWEKGE